MCDSGELLVTHSQLTMELPNDVIIHGGLNSRVLSRITVITVLSSFHLVV